jgi:hypothetical protein
MTVAEESWFADVADRTKGREAISLRVSTQRNPWHAAECQNPHDFERSY